MNEITEESLVDLNACTIKGDLLSFHYEMTDCTPYLYYDIDTHKWISGSYTLLEGDSETLTAFFLDWVSFFDMDSLHRLLEQAGVYCRSLPDDYIRVLYRLEFPQAYDYMEEVWFTRQRLKV